MQPTDPNNDDSARACRLMEERIQCVLDGGLPVAALDLDPHGLGCTDCRERATAAKLMLAALALRGEPGRLADRLAESIVRTALAERQVERRTAARRGVMSAAGVLALAAGVLLTLWTGWSHEHGDRSDTKPDPSSTAGRGHDEAEPRPAPGGPEAPAPRVVNLGEHISQAEQALINSSRSLAEPVAAAPQVLAKLTDALTRRANPTSEFEQARQSLLELPDAAQAGLQPVTSATQKAFARLLRDVGSVQPANHN